MSYFFWRKQTDTSGEQSITNQPFIFGISFLGQDKAHLIVIFDGGCDKLYRVVFVHEK